MKLEYLLDSRNLEDQYIQYMTSTMVLPTGKPNPVRDDKYFSIQSHTNQEMHRCHIFCILLQSYKTFS